MSLSTKTREQGWSYMTLVHHFWMVVLITSETEESRIQENESESHSSSVFSLRQGPEEGNLRAHENE